MQLLRDLAAEGVIAMHAEARGVAPHGVDGFDVLDLPRFQRCAHLGGRPWPPWQGLAHNAPACGAHLPSNRAAERPNGTLSGPHGPARKSSRPTARARRDGPTAQHRPSPPLVLQVGHGRITRRNDDAA